jgi:AcrR family transcriptional regulator
VGTKERRDRERLETREKILAAAREMFAEEGYEAVTMRAIAERIEYTPTAIYHHFKNKDALLLELCRADFESLAKHFNVVAHSADPLERIVAVGEAYIEFALKFPSQYRFMFMTVLPPSLFDAEYVAQTLGDPERNAYTFLRESCRLVIESGHMRPEITDPDALAQILWAQVHGLISLRIVKHEQGWVPWRDLAATARQAMDIQMRGLLRAPEKWLSAMRRKGPGRSPQATRAEAPRAPRGQRTS